MSDTVKERIVSERVVSRKVLGSANPIAKKFRNLKGSIGGVCMGPVLILLALVVLFYGEKMKRSSAVVESLSLEVATEVTADSDMHKMSGVASEVSDNKPPDVGEEVGNVLYYSYETQVYEEVEEKEYDTITKVEGGKEIEERVERTKIVEKWVTKDDESKWAEFKLGDYSIDASGADKELKGLKEVEYWDVYGDYLKSSEVSRQPDLGDFRVTVEYLELDTDLIVVGEISGSKISSGDPFIITDKSDSELLEDMKTEETTIYWITKGGAWLLLTIGFMSMLGPILSLLDFIPIAGQAANCAASVVGAVIALGIVVMGTLIIKFWWVFLILGVLVIVGLVILMIFLLGKKGGDDKKEDKSKKK